MVELLRSGPLFLVTDSTIPYIPAPPAAARAISAMIVTTAMMTLLSPGLPRSGRVLEPGQSPHSLSVTGVSCGSADSSPGIVRVFLLH